MLILSYFKYIYLYIEKFQKDIPEFYGTVMGYSIGGHGEKEKKEEWGMFPPYFIYLYVTPCECFFTISIFL